jgi:hypothetical protein
MFGMEVLIPAWGIWTIVFLRAYLFTAPWIFGISEAEASSVNAWIVGACIAVAPLGVPVASGPRALPTPLDATLTPPTAQHPATHSYCETENLFT